MVKATEKQNLSPKLMFPSLTSFKKWEMLKKPNQIKTMTANKMKKKIPMLKSPW